VGASRDSGAGRVPSGRGATANFGASGTGFGEETRTPRLYYADAKFGPARTQPDLAISPGRASLTTLKTATRAH